MGYPEVTKFDKIFLERTLENIESMGKCKNNFTLLVNSMLGLLILPNEYLNKNKYKNIKVFSQKINDIQEIKGIFRKEDIVIMQDIEKKISKCIFRTNENIEKPAGEIPLKEVLSKMRNAFAHFGIEPTKMGNDWHGILLTNVNKSGVKTMEIYLEKDELQNLVNYIVKCYLTITE